MARWIAALLLQATLGEPLDSPAATEDGLCSTGADADALRAPALLQKGARMSEGVPLTHREAVGLQAGLQMTHTSRSVTRSDEPNLLKEKEAPEKEAPEKEAPVAEGDEVFEQGPGFYEPLTEEGYQVVAKTCCVYNMEEYIRRVVADLGLQMCGEAGLNGLVPYYSCEKGIQNYAALRAELVNKVAEPCPVAALPNTCPADTSQCGGEFSATVHRRRNCKSGIANAQTTTTLTTTGKITTTTTLKTTTTKVTTTVLTTTLATTTTTTTTTTKAVTTTVVTTTGTTTTSTGCKGETDLLDFFNSDLAHNNLGGKGPNAGEANIRYEGIGESDGKSFDLVVEAVSGYTTSNSPDNGYECGMTSASCTTGRYGRIDVAAGTTVDLRLSFQDSGTKDPVTLSSFLFSIHDFDQLDSTVKEEVFITGFIGTPIVSNSSEVNVRKESDGRTRLKSTMVECDGDDPLNPMFLGPLACGGKNIDTKTRSVAFLFKEKQSIAMTLEATCSGCAPGSHRSFIFTGNTNLVTCNRGDAVY